MQDDVGLKSHEDKWKKAGKPNNEESVILKSKKECQSILRKAIKEHNRQGNIEENNTLIKANKIIFKLSE